MKSIKSSIFVLLALIFATSAYANDVQLSWEPSAGADSYIISWASSTGDSGSHETAETSWTHIDLEQGQTIAYQVVAVNVVGVSPPSNVLPVTIGPDAPVVVDPPVVQPPVHIPITVPEATTISYQCTGVCTVKQENSQ